MAGGNYANFFEEKSPVLARGFVFSRGERGLTGREQGLEDSGFGILLSHPCPKSEGMNGAPKMVCRWATRQSRIPKFILDIDR
jgi:hypothetical protein